MSTPGSLSTPATPHSQAPHTPTPVNQQAPITSETIDHSHFLLPVGEWAKCGVCGQVPRTPMTSCVSECTLCTPCMNIALQAPTTSRKVVCVAQGCTNSMRKGSARDALAVKKAIETMPLRCTNKEAKDGSIGCAWIGTLSDLDSHLLECKGFHRSCPFSNHNCTWTGPPNEVESHLSTCQYKVLICHNGVKGSGQECGQQMFVKDARFHLDHMCQFVSCPVPILSPDGSTSPCPVMGYRRMILQHIPHCQRYQKLVHDNRLLAQSLAVNQFPYLTATASPQAPYSLPQIPNTNVTGAQEVVASSASPENGGEDGVGKRKWDGAQETFGGGGGVDWSPRKRFDMIGRAGEE